MIARAVLYFGEPCLVACDAKCDKAWGINNRPRVEFDANDPDDYAFLPDHELGEAPADPGTYEGGVAKPCHPDARLNKWCARECERSVKARRSELFTPADLPDYSKRVYNIPSLHEEAA